MAAPVCKTSFAVEPSRSRRAISDACSVAGTADESSGDGSVATDDPPKTVFGPSTIGIFVFPLYDEAIGRATRPERTGGKRWHQGSGRLPLALPSRPLRRQWPTRRRNTAVF